MLFDGRPDLPVARVRPRESGSRLGLAVRAWLASRWAWLRPRWIPVAVAALGMLAMLAATSYLRELAVSMPPPPAAPPAWAAAPGAHPAAPAAASAVSDGAEQAPARHGRCRMQSQPR